jgi:phosphomannomutase
MLAAMHVLAEFGSQPEKLSAIAKQYNPYFLSGEINSRVEDVPAARARVEAAFAGRGEIEHFDGITISGATENGSWWWFNVRSSNTEPLLRLNVEAQEQATMALLRDEVLALILGK